jgi:hypothetical protein
LFAARCLSFGADDVVEKKFLTADCFFGISLFFWVDTYTSSSIPIGTMAFFMYLHKHGIIIFSMIFVRYY